MAQDNYYVSFYINDTASRPFSDWCTFINSIKFADFFSCAVRISIPRIFNTTPGSASISFFTSQSLDNVNLDIDKLKIMLYDNCALTDEIEFSESVKKMNSSFAISGF